MRVALRESMSSLEQTNRELEQRVDALEHAVTEKDREIAGLYRRLVTERNAAWVRTLDQRLKGKGPTGAAVFHTLSTGITFALTDKSFTDKIPIITAGYGRADSVDGQVFK